VKKPHKKPTVLKGTVALTERTIQWCDASHVHEPLNGKLKNGKLRTAGAQKYTVCFCKRLCRDFKVFLSNASAYPADDDDLALEDPYLESPPERQPDYMQPRAKRRAEPPGSNAQAGSSSDIRVKRRVEEESQGESEQEQQEREKRQEELERDLEEQIRAGEEAANRLEEEEIERRVQRAERREARERPNEEIVELREDELPADPEPAPQPRYTAVQKEFVRPLNDIRAVYNQRISAGVTATIQAGKRLKLLQEMFGTPHNIEIVAAVVAKKPKSTEHPEPLVSRTVAPKLCEVIVLKDDDWLRTKWENYSTTFYSRKKIPKWALYLYGKERNNGQTIVDPYQELAELAQDSIQVRTLPAFLDTLIKGSPEERTSLLLSLHKRMYHRSAGEIRKILHRAGVPLAILSHVDDAINSCETCKAFAQPGAKPIAKLSIAGRFNQTVLFDLVFIEDTIVFMCVDECTRYTVLALTESKTIEALERTYRKSWISLFGPPRYFRADKESAFASDHFAVFCAKMGTKVELIVTGQQHTWLSILDRRVQILRKLYPKLLRDMSNESLKVEPDDILAECQFAMNTGFSLNGTTPYACLFLGRCQQLFLMMIMSSSHHMMDKMFSTIIC